MIYDAIIAVAVCFALYITYWFGYFNAEKDYNISRLDQQAKLDRAYVTLANEVGEQP